jgi:hypothetical protein
MTYDAILVMMFLDSLGKVYVQTTTKTKRIILPLGPHTDDGAGRRTDEGDTFLVQLLRKVCILAEKTVATRQVIDT